MRKLISMILITLLVLSLVACGNSEPKNTTPSEERPEQKGIEVEKELFDVRLNLPASLFEDEDMGEVKKDAAEKGIHDVVVNEDGSVTYIMSKSQHRKLLEDLRKTLDENIAKMLSEDEGIFKEISFNGDCTELTVKVDIENYTAFDNLSLLGHEFSGIMYQVFNAVPDVEQAVKTNIVDHQTGEVIDTWVYNPNEN
jgi:uncharacterized lipoprotein YehR (DUF1307 family)